MLRKKRVNFMLDAETIDKLKTIAQEEKVSQSAAVSIAVNKFFADRDKEHVLLTDTLSTLLDEKLEGLKNDMNRVRVTANVIDRDTKVIKEFMNHYYMIGEFKKLITTEKYMTQGIKDAEELVKKRISKHRQRKLDYQKKVDGNKEESEVND